MGLDAVIYRRTEAIFGVGGDPVMVEWLSAHGDRLVLYRNDGAVQLLYESDKGDTVFYLEGVHGVHNWTEERLSEEGATLKGCIVNAVKGALRYRKGET